LRRTEIIDRERRWARPVAFAAFGVLIFVIASLVASAGSQVGDTDTEAQFLRTYDADSGRLILAAVLNAIGFALVAPPVAYLFKAAEARSERMRGGLIGVAIAGPLFLAAAITIQSIALGAVASDFVATDGAACPDPEPVAEQDDCIEDLIADDTAVSVASGLTLAGSLGLLIALVYTSLHAMRVGLLTRFVGTLGMAVGVASLFFGPLFVILFMFALGLLFIGAWPGGRPPAWDAGEAVPWPKPGESRSRAEPEEDEPVPGSAEEVFPDAAADEPPADEQPPEPGSVADEVDRIARDPRRKRKRRG
jgi:hypothetical protein